MNSDKYDKYFIGDLIVVVYDCWIHALNGSEFIREGDLGIIIQKKDQMMYKPIKIYTHKGQVGWVYASNIEVVLQKT